MILPLLLTLAANEVRETAISGQYLELRAATYMVSLIELNDRSGGVVSKMQDAEATDYVRTQQNFETVRITNGPTAQTVKLYFGDGDSGSNRFTGVVSGEVSLSAATLAALESVDLNAATLLALSRPLAAGAFYYDANSPGPNVPVILIAPAANVNGMIIHGIDYVEANTNTPTSSFIAKATAPVSTGDSEILMLNGVTSAAGATFFSTGRLQREIRVAAGKGLYWISAVAVAGGSSCKAVRYTLL